MNYIFKIIILFSISFNLNFAQNNLEYFLKKGIENSPGLKEYKNLLSINKYQGELEISQNSAFNVYISADFLFSPYFNNSGKFISTNPDNKAIGYDVGITNGGLYSAQVNLEKNIFNGSLLNVLNNQNKILSRQYQYSYELEEHNFKNQITGQYVNSYKSLLQYELNKEIEENISEQFKISGNLVEKGLCKTGNYLLLKVELQNQRMNVDESLQIYKNDLLQLYALCGLQDTQIVILDSVNLSIINNSTASKYQTKYSLDSLSILNQQYIFESKYDPQLKVFINTGLNALELDGIQRKFGFSAGLSFNLPLFDGDQKNITTQQSLIAQESIYNYKKYSETNLKAQITNSETKLKSLKKNKDLIEQQLIDYKSLIVFAENQLKSGSISMIEYLTLLRNFIELRKSKIEMKINYLLEINNYNYWNW